MWCVCASGYERRLSLNTRDSQFRFLFDLEILLGYGIEGTASWPISGRALSSDPSRTSIFINRDNWNENNQGLLVPLGSLDRIKGVTPG